MSSPTVLFILQRLRHREASRPYVILGFGPGLVAEMALLAWLSMSASLAIVQPKTVIKWHRMGFKLYWRWKSRPEYLGVYPSNGKFGT